MFLRPLNWLIFGNKSLLDSANKWGPFERTSEDHFLIYLTMRRTEFNFNLRAVRAIYEIRNLIPPNGGGL